MIMRCPLWSQWATGSIDRCVLTFAESMIDSLAVFFRDIFFGRYFCVFFLSGVTLSGITPEQGLGLTL